MSSMGNLGGGSTSGRVSTFNDDLGADASFSLVDTGRNSPLRREIKAVSPLLSSSSSSYFIAGEPKPLRLGEKEERPSSSLSSIGLQNNAMATHAAAHTRPSSTAPPPLLTARTTARSSTKMDGANAGSFLLRPIVIFGVALGTRSDDDRSSESPHESVSQ